MAVLTFKYGKNLSSSTGFIAGTMYLDINTGEIWFDDPENKSQYHQQIIDTDTFTYDITDTVSFG